VQPIRTFTVVPSLPERLEPLRTLAYNLRWAWHHETIELFRRLDADLWESTSHNPVLMLGRVDQHTLERLAVDEGFLAHLARATEDLSDYMSEPSTWFERTHGPTDGPVVAYFSAEFGVTDALRIFAGGLGMLAGDHLKSASDLGVPLVAVGLLYQQGYFRQRLNEAGWQQEEYEPNDFHNLPLFLERTPDGTPLTVRVEAVREVIAQVWRAQVGRVPLYLLDTNLEANHPDDRGITQHLYGGDTEMRLRQEIVLGIGGYRAIEALGLRPRVFHMNEGHSAFLGLERVRRLMAEHGLSFAEAREAASAGLVFTTHTPVEAGHDYFEPPLAERYLASYARELGLTFDELLGLGRQRTDDDAERFCMTVLALRLASRSNGVSALHGEVSRHMWQTLWPGVPAAEIPIGHVTNGVHFQSWISRETNALYDRYLGPRWRDEPADRDTWARIEHLAPQELWRTHERRRERMVGFARDSMRAQLLRRGASRQEIELADESLSPEALTIGFARRAATYKRPTLLLSDLDRLARILNDAARPVQVIYAGKAHPRDEPGKELVRAVAELAQDERFRRRLVFLEDYDMNVARYLVEGCDVWLNNPRRPREACGTSGMKAAANGVLNASTLDGWWDEAWRAAEGAREPIGWAIGDDQPHEDHAYQDQVEADALYDLIERDLVPTFYDRGTDGLPRAWIGRMKSAIASLNPVFNTHRMLQDYTDSYYLPSAARFDDLTADGLVRAKGLATWRGRIEDAWPTLAVALDDVGPAGEYRVGDHIRARALVDLGGPAPDEVSVEAFVGRVSVAGDIVEGRAWPMRTAGQVGDRWSFEADDVRCDASGRYGCSVRVIPRHDDVVTPFIPGLIAWAASV